MNNHDIAIEIEKRLCKEFGYSYRPRGTIFDADYIETRSFYDCINLLLNRKAKEDYTEFLDSIYECAGKNMNCISNPEAVYREFRSYIE